jgi:hypothetical protein
VLKRESGWWGFPPLTTAMCRQRKNTDIRPLPILNFFLPGRTSSDNWNTRTIPANELMRRCFRIGDSLLRTRPLPCRQIDGITAWRRSIGLRSFHASSALLAIPPQKAQTPLEQRISAIPIDRFRNFCIVAHVDHGKSTLSDRLLELTGTIQAGSNKQVLDKLEVERERGITVKAQTCSMIYKFNGEDYLLNLVDTPGHVDFRAEVSRSYASCGGGMYL